MTGTICRLVCAVAMICASGCAMCSNCDDYAYSSFVGRWERLDPCYGRVGSAFTPEVGQRIDDPVDGESGSGSEEVATPEPTPAELPNDAPPQGDAPATPGDSPSSPDSTSPEATSPDATSPATTPPGTTSPSTTAPETTPPETSVLQPPSRLKR